METHLHSDRDINQIETKSQCAGAAGPNPLNDVHSACNLTYVRSVAQPTSLAELQALVRAANQRGLAISVGGARHAMGTQQFDTDTVHVDMRGCARVLNLDVDNGRVTVEAGIQWPELIEFLNAAQEGAATGWSIAQKQTGADRLTIGGAVAANVHGRGLRMAPFVQDIESMVVVTADGEARTCSRTENAELFRLIVGGYGLFGVVYSVTLRLVRRHKVQRVVSVERIENLMQQFEERIDQGFEYGDFQYCTDEHSDGFLTEGVFSCYLPVDDETPIDENQAVLSAEDWKQLILLAHVAKGEAYERYTAHYLRTSGQVYWSDRHQLSTYLDDYHRDVDAAIRARHRCSEMISELYVPRSALTDFMQAVRRDFRDNAVNVIYGTIRLIEQDRESFLAWAREPWACVIFNLHVEHTPLGFSKASDDFRRLTDRAIEANGSYYLTYHRFATRTQVEACYPQMREFLQRKLDYDPEERFQSDWYRFYRTMFAR